MNYKRGFTLVELIIAVGLFAIVMLLTSGAYFIILSVNQRVQSMASGIDNASSAFESMVRDIRSGKTYDCGIVTTSPTPLDCPSSPGYSFSFFDRKGNAVSYSVTGSVLMKTVAGSATPLTDLSMVKILAVQFFVSGAPPGDGIQPRVVIVIAGQTVGKIQQNFVVQTEATMRGPDL